MPSTTATRTGAYLERCWDAYTTSPEAYVAPYVTLVQSSGFGKTQLVKQLAQAVNTTPQQQSEVSSRRLLYTCFRDVGSTGFPEATLALNDFFFPILWRSNVDESEIAWRLFTAFEYANEHWDSVDPQWMELFARGQTCDGRLTRALHAKMDNNSAERASMQVDERAIKSCCSKVGEKRVLIFVVGEAHALLKRYGRNGVNHF